MTGAAPRLSFRDGDGRPVVVDLGDAGGVVNIGRRPDNDVALTWDAEVSRVHAQLERVGGEWALVDDGLSRHGSFVNGERAVARRRLRDGDRLCFGGTEVVFHTPDDAAAVSTASVTTAGPVALSETQRRVLVALCRPLAASAYAPPATNRDIASELFLSVDAVKAHLRVLFVRFGLEALPQNQKRSKLAAMALLNGWVRTRDL